MTRYNIFSGATWNDVTSYSGAYANARNGTGNLAVALAADGTAWVGQRFTGGNYYVSQGFMDFSLASVSADELLVSAHFRFCPFTTPGAGSPDWNLEIRNDEWGATITTADFVPGASLAALDLLANVQLVNRTSGAPYLRAGSDTLMTRLASGGTVKVVLSSYRHRLNFAPAGLGEYKRIVPVDYTGTSYDPQLNVFGLRKSTLAYVGGASVQLSDGTHAYLDSDGAASPVINIKHRNAAGTVTTVALLGTGSSSGQFAVIAGFQSLAMVRDSSDNLYVIGKHGPAANDIIAGCLLKGAGHTWTPKTCLTGSMPAYQDGSINNLAAAWHPTTGAGHIMVMAAHRAGTWGGRQVSYATLKASSLQAGSGTLIADSGDPQGSNVLELPPPGDSYTAFSNETGSNLDIAAPEGATYGAVASYSSNDTVDLGRYQISTSGVISGGVMQAAFGISGVTQDANSKVRLLPIDSVKYAVVSSGRVSVKAYAGTTLGTADLSAAGLASLPSAAAFQATAGWDAVYDPALGKVWVYYLDAGNSRNLLRIGVSLNSYGVDAAATVVNSSVGATGTSNTAVRVPRSTVDERKVLVQVANISGATLTTQTVVDSLNQAPNAPSLTAHANYDARQSTQFAWTFSDPNPDDTQTAYELEIDNNTTGASAYRSGKVTSAVNNATLAASALSNAVTYRWRVRTYDVADATGAYAAYSTFTTSAQGTVTITDPASDNPAGVNTNDYTVVWTYSATGGATQAQRRVKVVKTSDGSTLSDTGMQVTTTQNYTISGMASGSEYRIEVTVIDTAAITSITATRLITPSYANPVIPLIGVTAQDSYMEIAITNPTPTGDEPTPTRNDLYRRVADGTEDQLAGETGDWVKIAELEVGAVTYRDYTAASGLDYEYYTTAVV